MSMTARSKKATQLRAGTWKYPLARLFQNAFAEEVAAILLLGFGILYFLALISYSPGDLPSWVSFHQKFPPNDPVRNFIGPVGAVVAGYSYFLLGASAVALATVLLGLGAVKLFHADFRLTARMGWVLLFVLTTACLLELQPWFFQDWNDRFQITGAGGLVGSALGRGLLREQLLGAVGSALLLLMLYGLSLIMIAGLKPTELLKALRDAGLAWWDKFQEHRQKTLERRKELRDRNARESGMPDVEKSPEPTAKQASTKRRKPRKKAGETPDEPPADPPDEFANTPEVEIIDTSAPGHRPADDDAGADPNDDTEVVEVEDEDDRNPSKPKAGANTGKAAGSDGFSLQGPKIQGYRLPSMQQLDYHDGDGHKAADPRKLKEMQDLIVDTLKQFNINVAPGNITKGPTITRYEVYPAKGVRVDKIVSLERDIARATRAEGIHILAPIPGKDTVGIEIANHQKVVVTLRELLEGDAWQQRKEGIPLALGKDVYGKTIVADLAKMPHLLVAGATGSGKSVCINSIIASIIYRYTPEELRFIMIDPKVVELQLFNRLPHMAVPVVTDPKKVLLALRWVINEMEKRYRIFAHCGVKNLAGFNERQEKEAAKRKKAEEEARAAAETQPSLFDDDTAVDEPAKAASDRDILGDVPFDPDDPEAEPADPSIGQIDDKPREEEEHYGRQQETLDGTPIPERLPYIVVIIDELADLMQTAPADVESAITRIAQKARAAGIHLIVATQTPRADVVTGVIKANIPCRIAFQVSSKIDSRVILDENGAERLLGQGDMFYLPPGTGRLMRAQGALVTEREMGRVVDHIADQAKPQFDLDIQEELNKPTGAVDEEVSDEDEELVEKCLEVIRQEKKASTSMLQRRLRLGYTRAARIVDILEERGILGPGEGAKPREILVDLEAMAGTDVEEF
jgi:S-DNA-T family DNA segregation ATPase FtsK/SpoIIIE